MTRHASLAGPRPASGRVRGVLLLLATAFLPYLFILPPWVAAVALAVIGWRLLALYRNWRQPGLIIRIVLVVFGLLTVVASFRGFGGAEAGGAFLVITASLKAMESRNLRDFRIVALLVFILLAAAFLLNHSLPFALYAAFLVWLATAVLLSLGEGSESRRTLALRASRLLAAALPIAIALFLLFPRLAGPLFRFGAPRMAAVSGLADSLSPGSIAALAASDEIAFRVHFDGALPPPGERYFRGPVFVHYDGESWLPGQRKPARGGLEPRGEPVRYRVMERGNGTRFLFALALPVQLSVDARLTGRYTLLAPHRIWNDITFTAVSYPDYRIQAAGLGPVARRINLALPAGINPKARALAERWRKDSRSPAEVVQRALAWFHERPYYYTLTPGLLRGENRLDRFLFETRRGFCEHYASAFAFLMRAAGIPARVVTGYAGGKTNPYDGWLVLRQANAHAWDEVWLAGRGWVRVDPTAAIPPGRVESSARFAAALGPARNAAPLTHDWLWHLGSLWDAANTFWMQYVIGYDAGLQHRLLGRLGLGRLGPTLMALVMAGLAIGAGLLVFLLGLMPFRKRGDDPAQKLYEHWCRRLKRHGIQRGASEGPLDFAVRVARLRPQDAALTDDITELYIRARYAEDPSALELLKRRIRLWHSSPRGRAEASTGRQDR
ncbi:MAG: DUF3488 and transglutaminase-like domain-containing protein [Gammaproteobacteria bacterium]|nr:DUF3488 and transglutaminase-like domain-containing protein [Gammaproteobacteria bacterium]